MEIEVSRLLARWADHLPPLAASADALSSFAVPYERLALADGWVVWLGHPPIPDGLPLLPVPDHLLWDDPTLAVLAAAVTALDYAESRGASSPESVRSLLAMEGPVALLIPDQVDDALLPMVNAAAALGLPVVRGPFPTELHPMLRAVPGFAARTAAHATPVGRPHDPALTFQPVTVVDRLGGNSLSSFVLHHEGERDGVSIVGEPSARVGIEVGVLGPGVDLAATAALERAAATFPSFLGGVTSAIVDHSLEIGWADGMAPSPTALGEVIRAWLKALHGVSLVDVRIAFAPPHGRSARLTDMRARAAEYKAIRTTAAEDTVGPNPTLTSST